MTAAAASADTTAALSIRGHEQTLHLYGHRGDPPVVVASGDGGWVHLAPHVAATLAANGYFVIGFDTKSYLESFTSARDTLHPGDVPGDFGALVGFASTGAGRRPILAGVSEGAGLSVLAAAASTLKNRIDGVLCLGLPDTNELGWRWRDDVIYVTHAVPNEPTFSSAAVIAKVAPLPLAAVHSSRDEFVPVAQVERVIAAAGEPKRLWIVNASDHRFSGNIGDCDRRLLDAIGWIHLATPLKAGQVG
jgi:type IV secretory pathway VirJ component